MAINSSQQRPGPDFAKIYTFLGSLFDPTATGHEDALNSMTPVDRETIQFLMHNLAVNLANQQFKEQHLYLLEKYRQVSGTVANNQTTTASSQAQNPLLLSLQYFSPPNPKQNQ